MFCATLGLLLVSLPVFSQLNLGRIFGGITDPSGAAIVGATVTVTDVARGISRVLTPDSAGEYSAPSLTPGTYTVRAEASGFQTVQHTDILVGVGQDIRVDITLQPGAQTQTVTVTGEIPIVNTTNAQLGGTLESTTVTDLPLNAGQYTGLLNFQPGVMAQPGAGGQGGFITNGGRASTMVWNFDGLSDVNIFNTGGPIIGSGLGIDQNSILPVDAIQDMTVIENAKAEYGWKPGAQVNVGLKSGTNSLHGTAKGFLRNAAMDAKNPFLLPSQHKALDDLQQYGGTIGGPIKKDKIFFFAAYEGQHLEIGIPKLITVPTTAAGLGPASSFQDAIAAMNAAGHPISALSLNLAGCTAAGVCNAANGLFGNTGTSTTVPVAFNTQGGSNSSLGKIDYQLNAHNSINGEYFFGQGQGVTGGAVVQPWWRGSSYARVNVARGVWVWTPNSTWVNEMRFGLDRENFPSFVTECEGPNLQPPGVLQGPNYASQFGFIGGSPYCGFPSLTISGFTALGGAGIQANVGTQFAGLDTVSYTHGNHLFKFGINIAGDVWNGAFPGNGKGSINFGITPAFAGATALEDFLSGSPSLGSASATTIPVGNQTRNLAWNNYAGFVQDDWRLTRTLTVNLGLRYEYTSPITDRNNLLGNFDPSAPTGLIQAGIGGHSSEVYKGDHKDFEPRLGLAWDVTGKGKTVIRAGGSQQYATPGVFIYLNGADAHLNAFPTGLPLQEANGSFIPSPGTIQVGTLLPSSVSWAVNTPVFNTTTSGLGCGNGLGAVNATAPAGAGNPANFGPCVINGQDPNNKTGYVITWTVNVQHAFTNDLSLTVGYVGNHGGDLTSNGDYNLPSLGAKNGTSGGIVSSEQVRRPYYNQFPYLGTIYIEGTTAVSNYDGLQVTLTKRTSHGLTFLAGYTFAHALSNSDVEANTTHYMDAFNPRLDYSSTSTDARHHFSLVASYLIPGKKAPGQLLKGWQLNSTVTISSPFPYNALDSTSDVSGTGEALDRWTLVGKPSSFKAPGTGTFPCFGAPGSSFAKAANCVDVLPAACIAAAAAEPNGPAGVPNNTGLAMLNSLGCYMENGSVIVPPAQGTFGSMARNMLRGKPFYEWDASLVKNWKFKDRHTIEFRFELFNVLNTTSYIAPTANPNVPTTFGQSSSTTNSGSPVIGSGSPRETQLGLKYIF